MIVVADTSVLNYVAKLGCLSLLPSLFGEVIIPEAVSKELSEGGAIARELSALPLLRTIRAENITLVAKLHHHIDLGESEAIALAIALSADYLLIDDGRGRKIAVQHGLNITGLLGVFVLAKKAGIINEALPLIERLLNETDFRADNPVIQKILLLTGEAHHL